MYDVIFGEILIVGRKEGRDREWHKVLFISQKLVYQFIFSKTVQKVFHKPILHKLILFGDSIIALHITLKR